MHVPAVLRRVLVLSVVAILVSCAHSRSVSVVQQYFDY